MTPKIRKRERTIKIRTSEGVWSVPFGFGEAYREAVADHKRSWNNPAHHVLELLTLCSIMRQVGYSASEETIEGWPVRKRVDVLLYCANVLLRASDNLDGRARRAMPRPAWMPQPWKGPVAGKVDTISQMNRPTEIRA